MPSVGNDMSADVAVGTKECHGSSGSTNIRYPTSLLPSAVPAAS